MRHAGGFSLAAQHFGWRIETMSRPATQAPGASYMKPVGYQLGPSEKTSVRPLSTSPLKRSAKIYVLDGCLCATRGDVSFGISSSIFPPFPPFFAWRGTPSDLWSTDPSACDAPCRGFFFCCTAFRVAHRSDVSTCHTSAWSTDPSACDAPCRVFLLLHSISGGTSKRCLDLPHKRLAPCTYMKPVEYQSGPSERQRCPPSPHIPAQTISKDICMCIYIYIYREREMLPLFYYYGCYYSGVLRLEQDSRDIPMEPITTHTKQ